MIQAESARHPPVLALVGPTAIGKTALSLDLAEEFNCEIVSVDSMQVYRYMDIGTAKITRDEMRGIPHHLLDIVSPDEDYDAARFVRDAAKVIAEISGRQRIPLLVGGTGLYLKSLTEGLFSLIPEDKQIKKDLQIRISRDGCSKLHEELAGYDPLSAARIHVNDAVRIIRGLEIFLASGVPWSTHLSNQKKNGGKRAVQNILQIALNCDRTILYDRINLRSSLMLDLGFELEVRQLLQMGYGREHKAMNSIGYRHMLDYLDGNCPLDEMLELLRRDTRRYAKRQYTWFRAISGIEWIAIDSSKAVRDRIAEWLASHSMQPR